MNRGRFGAVTAGEDGDFASLIAQFTSELFDHGSFAGTAYGEVADGDDLDAQCGIAKYADIVKKATEPDGDLEDAGEAIQDTFDDVGPGPGAFFQDDLHEEGFQSFGPDTKSFTHLGSVCQWGRSRASWVSEKGEI